jgi:hypothetical protein
MENVPVLFLSEYSAEIIFQCSEISLVQLSRGQK